MLLYSFSAKAVHFDLFQTLDYHIGMADSGGGIDKPYSCDICNRRFTVSNHLARHKRTHTKEKPYGCDVCNKRFIRSDDLRKHQRSHTGEKPYECFVCNKRFSQSSNLSRHKLTHIGNELYEFVLCNKVSTSMPSDETKNDTES